MQLLAPNVTSIYTIGNYIPKGFALELTFGKLIYYGCLWVDDLF